MLCVWLTPVYSWIKVAECQAAKVSHPFVTGSELLKGTEARGIPTFSCYYVAVIVYISDLAVDCHNLNWQGRQLDFSELKE